jgi:FKBP-type peptidyl-prolyl cis-trans isomerase FkpA
VIASALSTGLAFLLVWSGEIMLLPTLLTLSRRALLLVPMMTPPLLTPPASAAAPALEFSTAGSGLQWADAKVGTGQPLTSGQRVAIDYVMSTSGARYGSKIDSTVDRNAPYAWILGDGSTIAGLEQAVAGSNDGVPPMLPGGVRRVIIPSSLAYADLAKPNKNSLQMQDCSTGRGPIPPREVKDGDMGEGAFQRFKNIYCNANKPYQPDLVLDVKLFGKRS